MKDVKEFTRPQSDVEKGVGLIIEALEEISYLIYEGSPETKFLDFKIEEIKEFMDLAKESKTKEVKK